jgi:hypothetical protein
MMMSNANIASITRKGTTSGGVNQHEISLVSMPVDANKTPLFKPSHAIKVSGTPANDGYYMILAVKGNVLIVNKEYMQFAADQPTAAGTVRVVINIINAQMERAVALIAQPLRNGVISSPGAAFHMADANMTMEKSRPKENTFTRRIYDPVTGKKVKAYSVPPLMEYRLSYLVNVWATYEQYMVLLDYQMLGQFRPDKFLWIAGSGAADGGYDMNYTGNRMNRQFHGQWAHLLLDSRVDASEMEPGDAAEATHRMDYTVTVENAYLPMPFDNAAPIIGQISLEQHILERIERLDIE